MSHRSGRTRRSGRGWYLAVVPAIAFALAASSFRFIDVYLPNTPSDETAAVAGEQVHFADTLHDEGVDNEIAVDVTLTGVARVREEDVPETVTGTDIDVLAVDFDWAAAPEVPLRICSMRILTADGAEYEPAHRLRSQLINAHASLDNSVLCVPEDTPGPYTDSGVDLGIGEYEDPPRPESWSTTAYFIVPAGTTPEAVRVVWQVPSYLEFTGLELAPEPVALPQPTSTLLF